MKNLIKKASVLLMIVTALSLITPQAFSIVSTNNIVTTVEAATKSKKIKISKKKLILFVKKSETLSIQNNKKKVKWASSDITVATVNSKGKVKAIKSGSAVVTATVGSETYECQVTVENPYISDKNIKVAIGNEEQLTINDTTQKIKWSSSNKKIATVNSNGLVKGKKVGKAEITAVVNGKSFKSTVTVTKKSEEISITSCKILDKDAIQAQTFLVGNSECQINLYCQVLPETADCEVIWTVSDTSLLNVDTDCYSNEGGYTSLNQTIKNSSTETRSYRSRIAYYGRKPGSAIVTATVKGHPEMTDSVTINLVKSPDSHY